jgi:hypothetical protein
MAKVLRGIIQSRGLGDIIIALPSPVTTMIVVKR